MFRKYTLIFLAAVVFCPGRASAQTTMDAVMKLQAMLNTLSEARGTIEKIASSENFMSMTKNLGNPAKLMETLKKGGIFNQDIKDEPIGKAAPVLPAELAAKADDPNASAEWMRNNMRAGTQIKQVQETRVNQQAMTFVALAQAYGKAVATRKKLDKSLSEIPALEEDGQKAEETSETALLGEINRVKLLTLEQAGYTQLLRSAGTQAKKTIDFFSIDANTPE